MAPPERHCALIVGHSKTRPGAQNSSSGLSEFGYSSQLARTIQRLCVGNTSVRVSIVYRISYRRLPSQVNALRPDFCLSLHCNAFDRRSSGTQTLYYHASVESRTLAETLQRALVESLGLRDRGAIAVKDDGRGAHLLRSVKAPCVIAEPFFIDNDLDSALALERFERLAGAYAEIICAPPASIFC